ncbi:MAG: primosomal protein N' [Sciscionella sp.]
MTAKARRGERRQARALPVARICVDVPLAHLDRPFDYLVSEEQDTDAVAGCRVRVRFAGQLVDGFLLARAERSDHVGRLAFLERVVSPEPVLAPEIACLARAVADRYAGTLTDVLRLAIPPRHAKVEGEPPPAKPPVLPSTVDTRAWRSYPRGPAYLDALRANRLAHAVWQAVAGEDWPARLAEAAATVAATGRGVAIVVPDHRDVARVHAACAELVDAELVVALAADAGPATRYRRWLAIRRGSARVVVGTRSAMFAPVAEPGLLVVWDDGDDLHADPHAPYPHVRDVLAQRAHLAGASLLIGGFARTAEAQSLLDSGWAHEIVADRRALRTAAPRVSAVGDSDFELVRDPAARAARLPAMAFQAAREALRADAPVLVQVPRRGYVPALACGNCRAPARCRRCAGPLALPGSGEGAPPRPAACRWCGAIEVSFRCPACGSVKLRAVVVGAKRTAEELGRAFAGTPIRTSGAGEVLSTVAACAALVVATPGAEPVAERGYGAALLLDGWALLARADLRASEEALRRWMSAAALVRGADAGGRVVVIAEASLRPVQALVRWDPAWHAQLELADRRELGFPPAMRMASLDGAPGPLGEVLDGLPMPEGGQVLGPVPLSEGSERALVRVPRSQGRALAAMLTELQSTRTARKEPDQIRVRLDPLDPV